MAELTQWDEMHARVENSLVVGIILIETDTKVIIDKATNIVYMGNSRACFDTERTPTDAIAALQEAIDWIKEQVNGKADEVV